VCECGCEVIRRESDYRLWCSLGYTKKKSNLGHKEPKGGSGWADEWMNGRMEPKKKREHLAEDGRRRGREGGREGKSQKREATEKRRQSRREGGRALKMAGTIIDPLSCASSLGWAICGTERAKGGEKH
jgi:hypothetical protein